MGWYDVAKDAISVAQKAGDIDLYKKLLDLEHDMQDMQHENDELREQLKDLHDSMDLENEMEVSEDKKLFYRNHQGEMAGPYCPVCWQKDKRLSYLQHGGYKGIDLVCPICSYKIDLGGHDQESKNIVNSINRMNSHPGLKF